MHQLTKAVPVRKLTRLSTACSDALERDIQNLAEAQGMNRSSYASTVLQDHVRSRASRRNLPLAGQAEHFLSDLWDAGADGRISAVERDHLTDHAVDILSKVRSSR